MKLRLMMALCAALALTVGVATATAGGGNSGNAKQCQKGGWTTLYRSDSTSFVSQDDCVFYAAQGGILYTQPASITVGIYFDSGTGFVQFAYVAGTGFSPSTQMTFTASGPALNSSFLNDSPYVFTNASGAFNSAPNVNTQTYMELNCANTGSTLHVTATDGVRTAATDYTVPAC